MPRILEHTHSYIRWKKNFGKMFYKCNHPDCYHAAPTDMIEGKRTLCPICHQKEFLLEKKHFKMVRPRCPDCSTTKEDVEKRELAKKVQDVLETLYPTGENTTNE